MTRTDDQNYDNRPDGVSKQNWTNLVDYWYSPEFQKLSKLGKDARASLGYAHFSGATRFANRRAELEDANNKVKECLASSSSKSRVDIEVFNDLMYNGE
ncbi:Autophagy-related protein 20, partial [Bienertia sinuspersici]